jgi:hypothetical protein
MSYDINDLDIINYIFNPILLLVNIFCLATSIIILYIIVTKCDYKLPEMAIILILSITHTLSSTSELIFSILKLIFGYEFLRGGSVQCIIFATMVATTLRIELFTIGFLAFMRYAIVCLNIRKGSTFWLISYFMSISPLLAMYIYPIITLDANPLPSRLYCTTYLKANPNNYILTYINPFIFVIPCWVCTFCYFVIGIKLYKKLNQMKNEAANSNDSDQVFKIQKQKRSLVIQLSIVFIAFNVVYMPIYITLVLRYITGYIRTPIIDAIMTILFEVSRAIDPIITIIFQPELNHEFQAVIAKSIAKLTSFLLNLFK